MATKTDILTLAQWFSPGFPVGAFSYSHGLESAIETGAVSDAESLGAWVSDVLVHGSGRTDSLFIAAAHRADPASDLSDVDAKCRALTSSCERLLETDQQGAAFCRTTSAIWGVSLLDLTYPIAVGRAARVNDIPLVLTASMYLHAFASNLISVGMRLVPLGQTDGQNLIREVAPQCLRLAEETSHGDLDALTNTAFLADISAMQHETQYSRICRT